MKALHKLAFCILGEMVNFQNFDQRLLVIFWPIVDHSSLCKAMVMRARLMTDSMPCLVERVGLNGCW